MQTFSNLTSAELLNLGASLLAKQRISPADLFIVRRYLRELHGRYAHTVDIVREMADEMDTLESAR